MIKLRSVTIDEENDSSGSVLTAPTTAVVRMEFQVSDMESAFKLANTLRSAALGATDPVDAVRVPAARAPKKEEPVIEPEEEQKPPKKAAKRAPEPEPEPEEDEEEAEEEEDSKVEVIGKPTVKITKALKEASKLRDVLRYLIDQGIKSKKALLKECKALQPHVPVLERIEDLDSRVPKAAEIVEPNELTP